MFCQISSEQSFQNFCEQDQQVSNLPSFEKQYSFFSQKSQINDVDQYVNNFFEDEQNEDQYIQFNGEEEQNNEFIFEEYKFSQNFQKETTFEEKNELIINLIDNDEEVQNFLEENNTQQEISFALDLENPVEDSLFAEKNIQQQKLLPSGPIAYKNLMEHILNQNNVSVQNCLYNNFKTFLVQGVELKNAEEFNISAESKVLPSKLFECFSAQKQNDGKYIKTNQRVILLNAIKRFHEIMGETGVIEYSQLSRFLTENHIEFSRRTVYRYVKEKMDNVKIYCDKNSNATPIQKKKEQIKVTSSANGCICLQLVQQ